MWKYPLTWILGATLALGVGLGAAQLLQPSSPPAPQQKRFDEIPQSAAATSSGVTWIALGASFSGTETLVRMRANVSDPEAVRAALGSDAVQILVPSPSAFEGPFVDGTLTAGRNSAGEVLLTLPPIQPPADYDGSVTLTLTSLDAIVGRSQKSLDGTWVLKLQGPRADRLTETLRVEHLAGEATSSQQTGILISGERSSSETKLRFDLPQGSLMLSQPLLAVDDRKFAPQSFAVVGSEVQASFPPTPFGESLTIELGAIAKLDDSSEGRFRIDVTSAAQGLTGDEEQFAVPRSAVIEGDPGLVLAGERGTYGDRHWLGFEIAGDWHPENGVPSVFDQDGRELDLAHVQVGYTKDLDGTVRTGSTHIAAFVDDPAELKALTLVLGPASVVEAATSVVNVRPVK